MKNYDNLTLRDINTLLNKSDFYFIVQYYFGENKKFRIKRIEYDRKTPHNKERTRRENRGNFYLIYDGEGVENISEGILYDEEKQGGLWKLYRILQNKIEENKKVLYTSRSHRATEGTACDF